MSSSRQGRRSSARSRPRWEKASKQTMPLSNSCIPLMIVCRFQLSSRSARRWPPQPRSFTVRAMKSRRSLPVKVRTVSERWRLTSSVSLMILDLQFQGLEVYFMVHFFPAKSLIWQPDAALLKDAVNVLDGDARLLERQHGFDVRLGGDVGGPVLV